MESMNELLRKASFAKDSLQNNDFEKAMVRFQQVQLLLNECFSVCQKELHRRVPVQAEGAD